MDKNEVKKSLYKEKPIAYLKSADEKGHSYYCTIESKNYLIRFYVPVYDMGTSVHRFKENMPAHELIRWLQTDHEN